MTSYSINKIRTFALNNRLLIKTLTVCKIPYYGNAHGNEIKSTLYSFNEYMISKRIPNRNVLRQTLANSTHTNLDGIVGDYHVNKKIFYQDYIKDLKETLGDNFSDDILDTFLTIERLWLDDLDDLDKKKDNLFIQIKYMELAKDYLLYLKENKNKTNLMEV